MPGPRRLLLLKPKLANGRSLGLGLARRKGSKSGCVPIDQRTVQPRCAGFEGIAGSGTDTRRSKFVACFGIKAGSKVFRVKNVLRLAGEPIIFDTIVIPQAMFPKLTAARFKGRPNTIYHLYQSEYGITVVRSAERLRARLANAESAGVLDIKVRAPLLEIRRVALTFNDVPVEFRRSLVNTEHYEYFSDLAKSGNG